MNSVKERPPVMVAVITTVQESPLLMEDIFFPFYDKILLYYFPAIKQTDQVSFLHWNDDSELIELSSIRNGRMDEKTVQKLANLRQMTATRNELLQEMGKYSYLTAEDVLRSFKDQVANFRKYSVQIKDFCATLHDYRLWCVPEFVWDETLEKTDVSSTNPYFEISQMMIAGTMWALNCVSIIFNQKQHFELALNYMKDVQRMWNYFGVVRSVLQSNSGIGGESAGARDTSHTVELFFPHFYNMLAAFIEAQKQEIFIMGLFAKARATNEPQLSSSGFITNTTTTTSVLVAAPIAPPALSLISKLCYFVDERYAKAGDIFEQFFTGKNTSHRFVGEEFQSYCIEKSLLFRCLGHFYQGFTYDVNVQGALGQRISCLDVALGLCLKMQSKIHRDWIAQFRKKAARDNDMIYSHVVPKSPPKRLDSKSMLGDVESFI